MQKHHFLFVIYLFIITILSTSCDNHTSGWEISVNKKENTVDLKKDNKVILPGLYATYKINDKIISTKEYGNRTVIKETFKDSSGEGSLFKISYEQEGLPTLIQSFYLIPDQDFLFTEITLADENGIASNYLAPVNIDNMPGWFSGNDYRALFIPFDNDKWIRFKSHPLTFDNLTSYEVTSIFNNATRNGLVIGSVEHDNWKSAIEMTTDNTGKLKQMHCFGGIADELTRDVKEHGSLTGKEIKSPRIFIGFSTDWRTGLENYADANNRIAPRKEWNRPVPFGWNSWGALQFNITPQKGIEVSDFFKNNLPEFVNQENTVVIGLDSGWNGFPEEELKAFVEKCKANGQLTGIYWVPFTDWGKNPERDIEEVPGYKYKDVYIYANGAPQDLDGAYAIDPTHPAVEAQMKAISDIFHRCGFDFVKIDFLTHGALEGDNWYNPEIKTGIQAYNYGLKLVNQYAGDMFINFSICPIFPANYAHSRRIACDAWNKIKDTEYTLNALSYGWWIDRIYQYNDADHIVLRDATEGENRARITSSAITGLYIAGDDFSLEGDEDGKERSIKFLTNKEINNIARGISFRPIEGNSEESENQFYYIDDHTIHYAVFNYQDDETSVSIPFKRLNINPSDIISAKELWSGEQLDMHSPIPIPGKDVKMITLRKKDK